MSIRHDAILIETIECLLQSFDMYNNLTVDQQVEPIFFEPEEVHKFFVNEFSARDFNMLMSTSFGRGYLLGFLVNEVDRAFATITQDEEVYYE